MPWKDVMCGWQFRLTKSVPPSTVGHGVLRHAACRLLTRISVDFLATDRRRHTVNDDFDLGAAD